MSLSLFVLALSAFAIGTTEFVIMGLLPEVATDLSVSIPNAGWLITGYALGVAVGAPFMALLTARLPRRQALIILMGIFILGNLLCALAWGYSSLMLARVVTSLCHGAFFGIGAVTAANLVVPDKRASAVAMMFTGLTLANVLGVPLGTALGQEMGWRSTFLAVAVIGVIALFGLVKFLPKGAVEEPVSIRSEFAALRHIKLWIALFTTVMFSASMFALFTYIAPLLRDVTGVSPRWVTLTLFLIGIGLTIGNVVGGKLGDQHLKATLSGAFLTLGLTALLFSWTSYSFIPAEVNLFLWAVAAFSLVPALQINVVNYGKDAPNLTSTLNIGAFNVGNALGAWVGGIVLSLGYGLTIVPIAAGLLALVGFGLTIIGRR
jgi:DHA1 family inner membrane transport protein